MKAAPVLALCCVWGALSGIAPAQEASPRPHVLFLFADDYTHEALGALGQIDIETPHLDRLAREGVRFSHAYNMGSWSPAVCIASRTMLVTGRSLWRAQALHEEMTGARQEGQLWPQRMAAAGYRTWFTGKWHVRTEVAGLFDRFAHVRSGMPKDHPAGYDRPREGEADPWSPSDPKWGGYWEGGRHWSEVTADDALAFLQEAAGQAQAHFFYVAFNAPHDPRQAPPAYLDRYPAESIALPDNFLPEYPHKEAMGCGPDLRDERLAPFPRTEAAVQLHRREYYALISHLDAQVGRILDALEASGLGERTWIFFTADHGLAVGRHGLFGKQNLYEHSLRAPFLVKGPGLTAGQVIDRPIYLQDAMATALDLAGAPPRPDEDFHSLLPLLRGEHPPVARDAVYAAYLDLQRAVIHEGWKLILYPQARVVRLYHLDADPLEQQDRAGDPAEGARIAALFRKLQEWQRHYGDPLSLSRLYPELAAPAP